MTRIPLPAWQRSTTDQRLEMSTAEIGLPVRTVNCLEEVYRALETIGLCRCGATAS